MLQPEDTHTHTPQSDSLQLPVTRAVSQATAVRAKGSLLLLDLFLWFSSCANPRPLGTTQQVSLPSLAAHALHGRGSEEYLHLPHRAQRALQRCLLSPRSSAHSPEGFSAGSRPSMTTAMQNWNKFKLKVQQATKKHCRITQSKKRVSTRVMPGPWLPCVVLPLGE